MPPSLHPGDLPAAPRRNGASRLRGWATLLAFTALIGLGIAGLSSSAGYDERLSDIAARQSLTPAAYRASSGSTVLRSMLLDAAEEAELASKMQFALAKYPRAARQVLEAFGAEPALHDLLRRYGESVVPVVGYFMDNDVATLRASHALGRIGQAIQAHASSMFAGERGIGANDGAPAEYDAHARGRWAIAQIGASGHQFLAQFAIDAQGVAHWNQTDRMLKAVESFLLGGVRDLETRHDLGERIGAGDIASAGVDLVALFGLAKAFKLLQAPRASGRAAQWASQTQRRALLGQRALLGGGAFGKSALKLGATAGAAYLVLSHPGLLTGLFVEAGSWFGIPGWAAAAAGWWAVAFALSLLLLPLLSALAVLNPLLARLSRLARWLLGLERAQGAATEPNARQISTLAPSSTTALLGSRRNSAAAPALRCICANSFSRHAAMPAPGVDTTMSRERK